MSVLGTKPGIKELKEVVSSEVDYLQSIKETLSELMDPEIAEGIFGYDPK